MEYELMRGNYVEYNGFTTTVYGIHGPWPSEDPRFNEKVIVDLFDGEGLITATTDEIKPIKLTTEWLLKFGKDFKYHIDIKCRRKKVTFRWSSMSVTTGERRGWGCPKYPHISYLHELQNLGMALIGKTLEINN